jgi:hypothetical protein
MLSETKLETYKIENKDNTELLLRSGPNISDFAVPYYKEEYILPFLFRQ